MKVVILDYALVSPAVLAQRIEKAFRYFCSWSDIDEDFFEFRVYGCSDLASLEDVLAQYV